jgi:hypothetical protein
MMIQSDFHIFYGGGSTTKQMGILCNYTDVPYQGAHETNENDGKPYRILNFCLFTVWVTIILKSTVYS